MKCQAGEFGTGVLFMLRGPASTRLCGDRVIDGLASHVEDPLLHGGVLMPSGAEVNHMLQRDNEAMLFTADGWRSSSRRGIRLPGLPCLRLAKVGVPPVPIADRCVRNPVRKQLFMLRRRV